MESISLEKRVNRSFFERNPVQVARDIIGKVLVTCIDNIVSAGIIVESEAYGGIVDRASHVYGGKVTEKRKYLFYPPGHVYVYRIYGKNICFNITTGGEKGSSVFIRSLEPLVGIEYMVKRRGKNEECITKGPSKLSKALGITLELNGVDIVDSKVICVINNGSSVQVERAKRINIDYAGEDREKLWRFYLKGSRCITRR